MKFNVGTPDRIARLIIGVLLLVAPFVTGWALFANPVWTWAFVIVGLVLAVTALVRFCPIYAMLKLSTARTKDQ
jgi:membrane protein YdbS with pleckstrin-like domain